MKKIYSDADKTDMPVEAQGLRKTQVGSAKKAKINVIAKSGNTSTKSTKKSAPKHGADSPKANVPKGKKSDSLRSKLKQDSLDEVDLELLNEQSIKTRSFRGRRNGVVIVVLSLLLAISIAVIAVGIAMRKMEYSCKLIIEGDVSAHFLIDDKKMTEFKVPASIGGNKVLKMDTDLNITSSGLYYVEFIVNVYQGSVLLNDVQLTGINVHEFNISSSGKTYRSISPIEGDRRIDLFTGVAISKAYTQTLNINNFKMEVIATISKA